MTKATISALEKVFAAEIEGRLPFQSKSKIFQRLADDGLIQPMERKLGGRFPVTMKGWQLTHAGRILLIAANVDKDLTMTMLPLDWWLGALRVVRVSLETTVETK